jgi:formylglycine-generating enzyme required for sulfatase activity
MSDDYFGRMGIELKAIPAGEILLGAGKGADPRKPIYRRLLVRITRPFLMSKNLITQANWERVLDCRFPEREGIRRLHEELGDSLRPRIPFGDDYPAIFVNWHDVQAFCTAASAASSSLVRLPTDAQWEHAYRAGSVGEYYWGEEITPIEARKYAWFGYDFDNEHKERLHEVGLLLPNAWGLCDMAGMVLEWVRDSLPPHAAGDSAVSAAQAGVDDYWGLEGSSAIVRNASFNLSLSLMNAAQKSTLDKDRRSCFAGFRIVVEG